MNYIRYLLYSLLLFSNIHPIKVKIAAGILRIPQKQESSYPSLQEVLKPTRPLAPPPLHAHAQRGKGGIAVVGEKPVVMTVQLSKSEELHVRQKLEKKV